MFQRDQWGLVSPIPWGLSKQGGTAATSQALLSLFMHMGLIPLGRGLLKFHNCFSVCVSSAWAQSPALSFMDLTLYFSGIGRSLLHTCFKETVHSHLPSSHRHSHQSLMPACC